MSARSRLRLAGCWALGCLVALPLAAALAAAPRAGGEDAAAAELFEKEIRPLLLAECVSCHGPEVRQGGLRLDTREGALRGGGRGPALRPGRPEASLLLRAVRHEGPRMPPAKRLPAPRIAALESWIRQGAPWPAAPARAARPAAAHWAFRPLSRPAVPLVKRAGWTSNPVDAFLLARLERAGMSPSPPADRRTLIRRLYYDLVGLPPAPEEVEAFLADRAPDAYERVVDRLLASPHYGERWGRHWLDVARYADTKDGVLMYGDARVRPYAYTYRDYVIRALNEDTPYDRFVHEQLAADLIRPAVPAWRLAAMGFLTLGRQFDNNVHDVIDDRIDTVTRGLLGLTVACARCHDHKYDPVPTADYYSLYGVFAASEAPLELPVIGPPGPGHEEFEKQYAPKRRQLEEHLETQYALLSETARERAGDYLVHAATTEPDPLETAIFFLSLAPEDLRPQIVARWRLLLARRSRPEDPVFGPWSRLAALAGPGAGERIRRELAEWRRKSPGTGPGQVNPLVLEALDAARPESREAAARAYGELLGRVYAESRRPDAPAPGPERRQLLELVTGPESPGYFPRGQTYHYMSRREKDAFGGMRNELDLVGVRNAGAPPRAMVLNDAGEPYEPRVFVRGDPSRPGEAVPRRFLAVLAGPERPPFGPGSGRLDLARAITAPGNPLAARVIVNRVWMHHFGEPLAPSPGDFGSRGGVPTHPELLDWLAAAFTAPAGSSPHACGWSLKRLHRLLVTSAAYRQDSADRPACRRRDPENRLLWRAHRRRLDFEQMRDTLLCVSGRLDRTPGGRPARDAVDPAGRRRTVYSLVDRQSLPEVFRAFDFPQPDQSVERRPMTTVPQQALFALNSPFAAEQARALAARPEVAGAAAPEARLAALYRLLFARPPQPEETAAGLAFLAGAPASPAPAPLLGPWEQLAQVLLLSNELMFLD